MGAHVVGGLNCLSGIRPYDFIECVSVIEGCIRRCRKVERIGEPVNTLSYDS